MSKPAAQQGTLEDQLLRLKFRSITYTAPRRQQQVESVEEDKKAEQSMRSYQTWKRVNASYFDEPTQTSAQAMQQYDEKDYQQVNRERFRRRNRDTEFMEFAVRDKALARK
eukprot:GDKJ01056327.1.p1 GENE.GDKJ01056327.1~~GDKJ01056327.1.p1  ORF type:complete len:111 (-),score=13.60 GDKJ01056327.1:125-457(-)